QVPGARRYCTQFTAHRIHIGYSVTPFRRLAAKKSQASDRGPNPNNTVTNNEPMPSITLRKSTPVPELTELPPLGRHQASIASDCRCYFSHALGRDKYCKSAHYTFQALALTVRDRLMERWKRTRYTCEEHGCRQAYYLSMEFLMGRTLNNAIL